MRLQRHRWDLFQVIGRSLAVAMLTASLVLLSSTAARALIWDAQAATDVWFDPVNWNTNGNSNLLIPASTLDSTTIAEGDADDYIGYDLSEAIINYRPGQTDPGQWDADGEGVVYDPVRDATAFASAATLNYPPNGYDRDTIWRLFLANSTAEDATANGGPITGLAKLTIRGNLDTLNMPPTGSAATADTRFQVGRSSGVENVAGNGLVVQESGVVRNNTGDVDLGSIQTAIFTPGSGMMGTFGNGTWDYRSGTLEIGLNVTGSGTPSNSRLRLSAGGSTAIGGHGTLIMHNPGNGAGGYVRVQNMLVAAFGGQGGFEPDGDRTGVGIVEFHYENGGTRAIQVNQNLVISNGQDAADSGIRSSRLKLVLDEAPIIDVNGKPNDLALIDVDSDGNGNGNRIAAADGAGSLGLFFSNADLAAIDPLDSNAVYTNGSIVTAMFGQSTYRWNIYYDGKIHWSDRNISLLDSSMGGGDGIEGPVSGGRDIVLIGLDSTIVEEGLAGDYNDDGVVDAGDYVRWRNHLGEANEANINNNGDGGGVTISDYGYWKTRYGNPGSGGGGLVAGGSAVPEPTSAALVLLTLFGLAAVRRRAT